MGRKNEWNSRVEARNIMVGDNIVLRGGIVRRVDSIVPMYQSIANKTNGRRGCYMDTNIEAPWTKFSLVFLGNDGHSHVARTYDGSQRVTVLENDNTKARRDAMRRERSRTGRRLASEVLA